jgi:hypothetical protein
MAEPKQFPTQPRGARHLYAVARFDGLHEGSDPIDSFALTRGYWDLADAEAQAERLNGSAPEDTRYFVLLVRVSGEVFSAKPS